MTAVCRQRGIGVYVAARAVQPGTTGGLELSRLDLGHPTPILVDVPLRRGWPPSI